MQESGRISRAASGGWKYCECGNENSHKRSSRIQSRICVGKPSTGPENELGTVLETVRRNIGAIFTSLKYRSSVERNEVGWNGHENERCGIGTERVQSRSSGKSCAAVLDSSTFGYGIRCWNHENSGSSAPASLLCVVESNPHPFPVGHCLPDSLSLPF